MNDILKRLNRIASVLEENNDLENANRIDTVFDRIAKKHKSTMPDEMKGGHKSAPKGYPEDKSKYADPVNFKYPIDTEKHARAAWAYLHQERNRRKYEPAEFNFMASRIKKALKKFGVEIEEEKNEK